MRVPTVLLLLALLLPLPGAAQERFERAVHIGAVDSLWSDALDESRPYLVYTPPSYADTTITTQRYPVLYLLDGDAHFHSVSGLVQILGTGVNGTLAVPGMIVVAIPNTDRTRDLTPTHAMVGPDGDTVPGFEHSGGNAAFFDFLENELIPRVESRYPTLPYRIFVGHSFGGITTLNALYTMPDVFDAYVAIDPSLWWDQETLLKRAKDYFGTADLRGKALYVAQANTLMPDDSTVNRHFGAITRFNAIMEAYDRSGIRYAFRYYRDDDHGSVPLIAEYDALRFIFDGYRVPLQRVVEDPPLLTRHFREISERLGTTFRPPEAMLRRLSRFTLQEDTAAAIAFGQMRVELYPESWRGWDFLGDLRAGEGDVAKARACYEEALRRNPDAEAVREKLEGLGAIRP